MKKVWKKEIINGEEREVLVPQSEVQKLTTASTSPAKPKYIKKRAPEPTKVETLVVDEDGKLDTSKLTDRQFRAISGFRKNRGNITLACKYAGCSRDTFYRWMNENKIFAHLVERARAESGDVVENKLWDRIDRGDPWAIQFWLKHNHPAYAEKLQLSVKAMTPSWASKMKLTKTGLSPKQLDGLQRKMDVGIKKEQQEIKSELDAALGTATVPRLPASSIPA